MPHLRRPVAAVSVAPASQRRSTFCVSAVSCITPVVVGRYSRTDAWTNGDYVHRDVLLLLVVGSNNNHFQGPSAGRTEHIHTADTKEMDLRAAAPRR